MAKAADCNAPNVFLILANLRAMACFSTETTRPCFLQVTTLSITLKGTKPAPESVEGLAVQAEALQHLAGVVMACVAHLKVRRD